MGWTRPGPPVASGHEPPAPSGEDGVAWKGGDAEGSPGAAVGGTTRDGCSLLLPVMLLLAQTAWDWSWRGSRDVILVQDRASGRGWFPDPNTLNLLC